MSKKIFVAIVIVLLVASLAVFADSATAKYGGTVKIAFSSGLQTQNYNPFSPNFLYGGRTIYEPLLNFNLYTGSISPWLAASYSWTNDNLKLIFNLRKDVQWSDGVPFTANDVVFTFNLIKKYPALDLSNVWGSGLKSVTAQGSYTVVFEFSKANVPALFYIGSTFIVPEHIWSKVSEPTTWTNPNPVGTGPFLFKSWNASTYTETYVKNPNYWQKGLPYIDGYEFTNSLSNTNTMLMLLKGELDWTSSFMPGLQQNYVDKNPDTNVVWISNGSFVALYPNDAKYPFNSSQFRMALSLGIDKAKVAQLGEFGYTPAANPSGITIPQLKEWLDPALQPLVYGYDPQKAIQILKSLGLKQDSSGYFINPNTNTPFSFNLMVVTGWTDWISSASVIADELKSIGINVNVQQVSYGQYAASLASGNFDLALNGPGEGINPYYYYNSVLNSAFTAPIGQQAISNYERWNDPVTDALLQVFTSTSDPVVQKRAISGIAQIMLTEVPVIPLFYTPVTEEYYAGRFVNWPSPSNPYDANAPWDPMVMELNMLNVHLK